MGTTCFVGVQLESSIVLALRVQISDKGDVYANYSMKGLPEAHASYHASGQQHIKQSGKYVEWNGGPTGQFEPMIIRRTRPENVITRVGCGATIGWEVANLGVLPLMTVTPDFLVDAWSLRQDVILAFEINVIGAWSKPLGSVCGFPILATHSLNGEVQVEINAFEVTENDRRAVIEPF